MTHHIRHGPRQWRLRSRLVAKAGSVMVAAAYGACASGEGCGWRESIRVLRSVLQRAGGSALIRCCGEACHWLESTAMQLVRGRRGLGCVHVAWLTFLCCSRMDGLDHRRL